MSAFGLVLLLMIGLGTVFTGLPNVVILLGTAVVGLVVGLLSGTIAPNLLYALPARIVDLMSSDLLQALPLFVLMGLLLNRLPVASALFHTGLALLPRSGASAPVAGLAIGVLIGPMNGSVGASAMALSRTIAPEMRARHVPLATVQAVTATAATLGVVVPPSLVLILLGDAMLNAHTVALNATGRMEQVVNTQNVFQGALVPAALFIGGAVLMTLFLWRHRPGQVRPSHVPLRRSDAIISALALPFVGGLLASVTLGYVYPVEAAACGALVLFVAGLASGHVSRATIGPLLDQAMRMTGALFALLAAATTLTLVFRLFGTDKLIADAMLALPGGPHLATGAALVVLAACALVLDAFEIVFVIVPIIVPPLLMRVPDATWVAVLILLTLQLSFLLPPLGYALVVTRDMLKGKASMPAVLRALLPYVAVQVLVLASVFAIPALVHPRERFGLAPPAAPAPLTPDEMRRNLDEMLPPPPDAAPAALN
ncbi:TRAP transporter large permease subunit [Azorhizobium doebereinerae]|uniref:TRAP transporter large permease subunit n=1 Tax=Azorhizobium doebereinerae TaxID=281091 RepID=UPI000426E304|nr:TRAP transporter large permease subunit [Azorhizobium doebereinerae]